MSNKVYIGYNLEEVDFPLSYDFYQLCGEIKHIDSCLRLLQYS